MQPSGAPLTRSLDRFAFVKSRRLPPAPERIVYLGRDGGNAAISSLYPEPGSICDVRQRHRSEDYWRLLFDADCRRCFHEQGGAEALLRFGYETSESWWQSEAATAAVRPSRLRGPW